MRKCAYCRSTTRNVSAGLTVFCNEQCHDAYFGVNEPQHSPEALEAAGYEPCSICGTLSQDQFCSDECLVKHWEQAPDEVPPNEIDLAVTMISPPERTIADCLRLSGEQGYVSPQPLTHNFDPDDIPF